MKYYLNLFIQEFVKTCKIAMRYKFDTIFYIFFWAVLCIPADTRSPIPVIPVHSVGNLQYMWQS